MLNDDIDYDSGIHAALAYDAVASAGPPSRPLEFPNPTVHRGKRITVTALDHRTGRIHNVNNVLFRTKSSSSMGSNNGNTGPVDRAYVIKKKISKSIYGVIRLCVVLKRRRVIYPEAQLRRRRKTDQLRDEDVEWESTEELCVVKV